MSATALILNGLLAVLLVVALGVGWRLERRLKALRDSHEGFAKAVADLDVAAARAEMGLADLRAATDEASEALAGRIAAARTLVEKLDERLARPVPVPAPTQPAAAPAPAEPRARTAAEIFLETRDGPSAKSRRPAPAPEASPAKETPRSRARVDDDLFEGPDDTSRPSSRPGGRR
ncbi:MAG: flagellar positioning protein PflI [Caulobacter sp.]|nr:flagellar positioning protein PflI [Caulobacter sp.]